MNPHFHAEMHRHNSAELDRAVARRHHAPARARKQREQNLNALGRLGFSLGRIVTAVIPR
jgi:hypothetical protein